MKRFFIFHLILAIATFITLPSGAQELDSRYEAMGRMTATIDGNRIDLVIPYDLEKERPYAERKMIMGSFLTINTVGRALDDAGAPARPMLQVTLQEQNGKMSLISAELFDDQGFAAPLVMGPDGGAGELADFTLEGDSMTAQVAGTFLRVADYTSTPRVADGAVPQPAVIEWTVTLPPLE